MKSTTPVPDIGLSWGHSTWMSAQIASTHACIASPTFGGSASTTS